MAGEQPKKVTGGAFGQYLAENRAALLKELPGQRATAAVKLASERFKALSDSEKSKYQNMYEAAKQKYEKDLAAFLSTGGEMKARKSLKTKADEKAKKSKDPNKPKKPAGGAFGCFLAKNRADFMKELGTGKGPAVAKLAGERWKGTSESEKQPYQKEFEERMAEYKKAMETYVQPAQEDEGDEEQEAEDEEKEEASVSKKRKATLPSDTQSSKKGKTAGLSEVEAEAKKLGFLRQLKSLVDNAKVKSSPAEILAELQKQNGSVIAAKKSLLGK